MTAPIPIPAPTGASSRYAGGWTRGSAFALAGGDLYADGPVQADDETWAGYIDALAAYRAKESA